MENFHIQEEKRALEALSDECERQMKMVGIDICDLPEDCASLLTSYTDLKFETVLYDLSKSFLEEFTYSKQRELIENQLIADKLEYDVKVLARQLDAENEAVRELKDFISSVKDQMVTELELEKTKILTEKSLEGLLNKKKAMQVPKDFSMDKLIAKIEILEKRKKPKH